MVNINPSNMTSIIIKKIKNDIINGVYQPGNRLLPLRELSIKYDVSRSVVNSVVSSLSAQGYLSVSPRHYVVVNDFLQTGTLKILDDVLDSSNQKLKLKLVKDVLEYRKKIETEALLIILRNEDNDLSNLRDIINKQREWLRNPVNDLSVLVRFDMLFHQYLLESTNNIVYKLIYRHFESFSVKMVTYFYQNYDLAAQNFSLYVKIFDAIIKKDEKLAVDTLSVVLDQGATFVLRLMK